MGLLAGKDFSFWHFEQPFHPIKSEGNRGLPFAAEGQPERLAVHRIESEQLGQAKHGDDNSANSGKAEQFRNAAGHRHNFVRAHRQARDFTHRQGETFALYGDCEHWHRLRDPLKRRSGKRLVKEPSHFGHLTIEL